MKPQRGTGEFLMFIHGAVPPIHRSQRCQIRGLHAELLAQMAPGPHPFRWTVSNLSFRPLIVIQRQ